ncbi:hypothetical protein JTB14_006937 [Gonioctena quinquepunctata]|nr:hypothetical protein JTB14_006937 [Gonioctena quinquepunctata]
MYQGKSTNFKDAYEAAFGKAAAPLVSIHECSGRHATDLNFRRVIATTDLNNYKDPPKSPGRLATSRNSLSLNRVSEDVRHDDRNHYTEPVANKKSERCAKEGCSLLGRTQ